MPSVSHARNVQEALTKIIAFYLQQHKQQPAFFEQLRLADESADDDLALLFERNKDTGRNISQRGITRPDLSGNGQLNCRNSTTSFTPRKPWWIGQLSPNTINCIFFFRHWKNPTEDLHQINQ